MEKATDLIKPMVSRILMDSWFTWLGVVYALVQYAPVIGMVKKTSKVRYNFGGLILDVKSIYRRLSKRRGRAKILSHALIGVGDIDAKLVFVEKIYHELIDVVMGQAVKLLGPESNQYQITAAAA